eukprot:834452_1
MGNEQQPASDSSISPKIKNAIDSFTKTLNDIESSKEQRSLIFDCVVPSEFSNSFNLNQWINIAKYVLETDSIITNMRQKCVPSLIKEDEFWQKYFYIVSEEKKKKDKLKLKKKKKKKDNNKKKNPETETKTESKDETEPEENKKEEEEEDYFPEDDAYQVLLHKPIIWLYKIPATIWRGRNNKCELWGLRAPIWMGRLRIVAYNHGKHIEFQFLEKDGKLFLKSTRIKLDLITDDDNPIHEYFDAYGVIDSSRYFIIWVDVPKQKTKKIPFGFGIRERMDAFDIRAVVADQMKIVKREINMDAINDNNSISTDDDSINNIDTHKFELNDDEMISIGHNIDNIDHRIDIDSKDKQTHKHSTILKVDTKIINSNNNSDAWLLPPPPPSPPLTPTDELTHIDNLTHHINIHKKSDYNVNYNDDDFGEFQTPNDIDNIDN